MVDNGYRRLSWRGYRRPGVYRVLDPLVRVWDVLPGDAPSWRQRTAQRAYRYDGRRVGAANEIWSYGEEACGIFTKYIRLREKLRPYVTEAMRQAHEKGTPVIRTLFYNFPEDEVCWQVEDEFFLGDDLLVCPVLYAGCRSREVYIPSGCRFRDIRDGKVYEGGQRLLFDAPLDSIPVFAREGKLCDI